MFELNKKELQDLRSKISSTKALGSNLLTLEARQKMVKESLSKAIEELHTGKVKHNAHGLFRTNL